MIIAHYENRLPENYDLEHIRALTKRRAAVWDTRPELYFKAFLLREMGRFGAIAHNFSSLYLWRQDSAYRDWLVSGGYKVVTDLYGRGDIHTRFALDARKGPSQEARFVYTESFDIGIDSDLTAAFVSEIERNGDLSTRPQTLAAAVGVDTKNWRFTRILLSTKEPNGSEVGVAYQILHLSQPLLDKLPKGGDR